MAAAVQRIMRWRPGQESKKAFQVRLRVHCLEGLPVATCHSGELEHVMLAVKWKGPKASGPFGTHFPRRSLKTARTGERIPGENGILIWEEEFEHLCSLAMAKDGTFQPWDIHFAIYQGLLQQSKTKLSMAGTGVMNIADFAALTGDESQRARIRVSCPTSTEVDVVLTVSINFVELRTRGETYEAIHKTVVPVLPCIAVPSSGGLEGPLEKARKKSGEIDTSDDGKQTPRSDDSSLQSRDLFDSDLGEEGGEDDDNNAFAAGAIEEVNDPNLQKSFHYGTLIGVNLMVEGALPNGDEGVPLDKSISVYSRSTAEALTKGTEETSASDSDNSTSSQSTMRSLLSWKRRRLSFRSPKREKGEPLLKKAFSEEGGDDIDHDRRQAGTLEPFPCLCWENEDNTKAGCLDFGDECFSIGNWEKKELVSRDGQAKLSADIFFATIDQRSESAAGESACTALVAVIADWLHRNPGRTPIQAEFDTLIREGSAEWRKLCEVEAYKGRFPDRHFDLDTVIEAGVRPLSVSPTRSFVGFFTPEGLSETCEFLQEAMSFDNIWDEVAADPALFVVSWNDHFFLLKVESDACYIIDTLGERLFEGCKQAYIIRFDKDSCLSRIPETLNTSEEKTALSPLATSSIPSATSSLPLGPSSTPEAEVEAEAKPKPKPKPKPEPEPESKHEPEPDNSDTLPKSKEEEPVVYQGIEACKEFVKGFFAALPLRELQSDVKKGLLGSILPHQRLQIEFHFTSPPLPEAGTVSTVSF